MNKTTMMVLALAGAVTAVAAADAPTNAAPPPGDWRFQALVYAYLPSVSGTTTFSGSGGEPDTSVETGSILDSLQFAFMGEFEAHRKKWGLLADVVYADFENARSGSRSITIGGSEIPAGGSATVTFDLTGWCWTVVGTYDAVDRPHVTVQPLAGTRGLDLSEHVAWQITGNIGSIPPGSREGGTGSTLQNWDAVVGARGRFLLGAKRRWFIPYYVDLGSGESNFTWQAVTGFGYAWSWGDLLLAYRYIDYDMKSGHDIESLTLSGPALGVAFHW